MKEYDFLNHIYVDQNRIIQFDRYFSYIESVKDRIPASLYDFACDVSRYELNGEKTLHDAWVEGIDFRRKYSEGSNRIEFGELTLRLVLAAGGSIAICYEDAIGYQFQGLSSNWPDKAVDLLVHEFSLESEGLFSHVLIFDRGVNLKVLFRRFSFLQIG